jgi:hypothetical protein
MITVTEVDSRTPFRGMYDIRLVVAGGRHYSNRTFLFRTLTDIHLVRCISCIIHGACPVGEGGADMLADEWAKIHGIPVDAYPVDHKIDGMWPEAGPRRNARMLRKSNPHAVIAFPGQAGTASLLRLARDPKLKLSVFEAR